jgi:hypothetical protein
MKRLLIIFFISEFLLSWCFVQKTFSQGEAGEDKICLKGSNGPVIGLYDDPLSCYTWEPKKGLNDPHSPFPTASPDSTTTYKLKIVGPDFTFTLEDEMTVYVVDKFKLEVENNLTECMENRLLTFTSTLEGDLPAIFTDQVEFVFHYEGQDGLDHTKSELSYDAKEDFTVSSEISPASNSQHKYSKPFIAEAKYHGNTIASDTLKIDVFELWIDYVRFDATKPWKAVVGQAFELSAISSSDCKNWDWDLDKTGTFSWKPYGGTKKTTTLTIPYSDLANAKNSYFGETFGTVTVKCEDGEGNLYTFKSTDMIPSQKVKVFFNPDKTIDGYTPTNSNPPSWFVFWKEGNVVDGIDLFEYDHTLDYGAYHHPSNTFYLGPLAGGQNSGPSILKDMSGNNFTHTGKGKHLQCLTETITHELYHKYVWDTWGPTLSQHNDSDVLPDDEEKVPGRAEFPRSNPFADNTFGLTGDYANTGYADTEVRCRIIELITGELKATHPDKDWSMDPENPQW